MPPPQHTTAKNSVLATIDWQKVFKSLLNTLKDLGLLRKNSLLCPFLKRALVLWDQSSFLLIWTPREALSDNWDSGPPLPLVVHQQVFGLADLRKTFGGGRNQRWSRSLRFSVKNGARTDQRIIPRLFSSLQHRSQTQPAAVFSEKALKTCCTLPAQEPTADRQG